jgi:hypothetical protein
MRFKTFLTEEQFSSMDELLSKINDDCFQFFREGGTQKALYRGFGKKNGMQSDTIKGYFLEHPENRTSRDSDGAFNFMFNAGAEAAFGERDIRTKSIFCTGSHKLAIVYGKLNFMFPAGDLDYIWSSTITDSFEEKRKFYEGTTRDLNIHAQDFVELMDMFGNRMSPHSFVTNEDPDDIAIGIKDCMDEDREGVPPTGEEIVDSLGEFFRDRYTNNDNLERAIRSNNEILINKSSGYYLVPVVNVAAMVNKTFEFPNSDISTALSPEQEAQLTPEALYNFLIKKIRGI